MRYILLLIATIFSLSFCFSQSDTEAEIIIAIDSNYSNNKYQEVIDLGNSLVLPVDCLPVDTSMSKALVLCGKAAFNLRNYTASKSFYTKAIDCLQDQHIISPSYLVESYTGLGLSYKRENILDSSAIFSEKAISIGLNELGENNIVYQNSLNNLGNTYRILGRFNEAINNHKRALSIKRIHYDSTDYRIGDSYNNMALVMHDMYEFGKAKVYYNEALIFYEGNSRNVRYRQALVNYNIARIHYDLKDYQKCDLFVGKAVAIMDSLGMDNRAIYYEMLTLHTNSMSETGRFSEAEKVLQKTLEKKAEILKPTDLYWNYTYTAGAILSKAQGNYDEALSYLNRSLTISKMHYDESHPELINTYGGLADIALLKEDLTLANAYIGEMESRLSARTAEMKIISSEQELLLWQKKAVYFNALYEKGGEVAQLDKGIKAIEEAISIFDKIKYSGFEQKARTFIAENHQYLIENALDLYEKKWENDETYIIKTLQLLDRNRNLQLSDAVKQLAAQNSEEIPREILAQGSMIRSGMIKIIESLSTKEEDGITIADYEEQLNEWNKYHDLIKLDYPIYYQKYFEPTSIDIELLKLQSQELGLTFVQYHQSHDKLFRFVIHGADISADVLEVTRNEIQQRATNVRNVIYDANEINQLQTDLTWLHEKVIGDLSPLIAQDRLVIIPHGPLQLVPFEILFTGDEYLVENNAVSYGYALHMWQFQNRNYESKKDLVFGGFAPSYEKETMQESELEGAQIAMLLRSEGERLPSALDAVASIRELVGGKSFIGELSTESKFKKEVGKFGVIHCAVHGILDPDNPLNSGLLFQPSDDDEDGLLTASEISRMNLTADLAVLSACNSGWGRLNQTEGLQSLGYAFAYAGTPSNVMSMWKVPDAATGEIMKSFYQNLKSGHSKDMALRNAKLTFLENAVDPIQKHPLHWAGFILNGNAEPISFSKTNFSLYFLGLLLALGLLILFFWRKKSDIG